MGCLTSQVSKADREKKKERVSKAHRMADASPISVKDIVDSKETVKVEKAVEVSEGKGDFSRSIEDAISTVIAEARRNITSRSPADERSRKKLVVKDVFLSDSEPERHEHSAHSDDDIEIIG